jgi:enterochelin esterase-like enzyme
LTEIFPEVEKIVKISHEPSQRACIGVSSGGICGFTSCWQHPEEFSAVISAVGSFDNIAHGESLMEGGHNYPFLIRLSDKKPIRAFLADGSHDLDNQFGNWFLGNQQMAAALKFKGYDIQWHPGEGFHSSDQLRSIFDQALVWWNGTE